MNTSSLPKSMQTVNGDTEGPCQMGDRCASPQKRSLDQEGHMAARAAAATGRRRSCSATKARRSESAHPRRRPTSVTAMALTLAELWEKYLRRTVRVTAKPAGF